MTEDQPANMITLPCPDGGCQNTMVSEVEKKGKNGKQMKNIKNFYRHKSNLKKKQQ